MVGSPPRPLVRPTECAARGACGGKEETLCRGRLCRTGHLARNGVRLGGGSVCSRRRAYAAAAAARHSTVSTFRTVVARSCVALVLPVGRRARNRWHERKVRFTEFYNSPRFIVVFAVFDVSVVIFLIIEIFFSNALGHDVSPRHDRWPQRNTLSVIFRRSPVKCARRDRFARACFFVFGRVAVFHSARKIRRLSTHAPPRPVVLDYAISPTLSSSSSSL